MSESAVYFRRFTETEWQQEQVKFKAEQARLQELDAHSADVVRLGDADAEAVLQIRFEPETGFSAGPVFGLRLYAGTATNT